MRGSLIVFLGLLCAGAMADSWGPPPMKWMSDDGRFALRRNEEWTKGAELTLVDLRGKPLELWTVKSPQRMPPLRVKISSDGRYVVLFDQYHQVGSGTTVAFLGPKGKVLKTYQLSDFIPNRDIQSALQTVSSTWWQGRGPDFIDESTGRFYVFSGIGTLRAFDLKTGDMVKLDAKQESAVREATAKRFRKKLAKGDTDAAMTLGAIRDRKSAPAFLARIDLSDDPRLYCDLYVDVLGDDAAPELARRANTRKYAKNLDLWIGYMPDGPKGKAAIRSLMKSNPEAVVKHGRDFLWEVINADDVRKNPHWLKSSVERTRFAALRALFENPKASDLPVVERVLKSKDSNEQYWALQALILIRPDDLAERLKRLTKDKAFGGYEDAIAEMARLKGMAKSRCSGLLGAALGLSSG